MRRDSSYLAMDVQQDGKDCVLFLPGELDVSAVTRVRQAMTAAAGSDTGRLVLDLAGLTYVDCRC